MYPLELSVRDKQLILSTAAADVRANRRWLEDLTAAPFRQLLPLHVHIWQQRQQTKPRQQRQVNNYSNNEKKCKHISDLKLCQLCFELSTDRRSVFSLEKFLLPMFLVERVKPLPSADSMSARVSVRLSMLLTTVNGPTLTCSRNTDPTTKSQDRFIKEKGRLSWVKDIQKIILSDPIRFNRLSNINRLKATVFLTV